MRKIFSRMVGLTAALALTVTACSESLTGVDSGEQLSQAEVAAVVEAFFAAFDAAEAEADASEGAAAPALAPSTFDFAIDLSVPCESGTFDMSGSFAITLDDETMEEDGRIEVTWEPMDCVVSDDTNTFTLNGAPRVEMVVEFAADEAGETIDGTLNGGFSFESEDLRSGSCAMDVTFHVETDGSVSSASTVSGTVCGLDADDFEAFSSIGNEDQI